MPFGNGVDRRTLIEVLVLVILVDAVLSHEIVQRFKQDGLMVLPETGKAHFWLG